MKSFRFINQHPILDAVESLIGYGAIQSSEPPIILSELNEIEQAEQVLERPLMAAASVKASLQPARSDTLQGFLLFLGVAAFSHEAYAGNQSVIAADQRIQIALQWITYVLLKIRRVAAWTAVDTVGYGDREAYLRRYLLQCHCTLDVLQRGFSHLRCHARHSSRCRFGCRPQSGYTRQ